VDDNNDCFTDNTVAGIHSSDMSILLEQGFTAAGPC